MHTGTPHMDTLLLSPAAFSTISDPSCLNDLSTPHYSKTSFQQWQSYNQHSFIYILIHQAATSLRYKEASGCGPSLAGLEHHPCSSYSSLCPKPSSTPCCLPQSPHSQNWPRAGAMARKSRYTNKGQACEYLNFRCSI